MTQLIPKNSVYLFPDIDPIEKPKNGNWDIIKQKEQFTSH